MTERTIEVIVKVATEVFTWLISILRDKSKREKGEKK
jgi:hypothetical protein